MKQDNPLFTMQPKSSFDLFTWTFFRPSQLEKYSTFCDKSTNEKIVIYTKVYLKHLVPIVLLVYFVLLFAMAIMDFPNAQPTFFRESFLAIWKTLQTFGDKFLFLIQFQILHHDFVNIIGGNLIYTDYGPFWGLFIGYPIGLVTLYIFDLDYALTLGMVTGTVFAFDVSFISDFFTALFFVFTIGLYSGIALNFFEKNKYWVHTAIAVSSIYLFNTLYSLDSIQSDHYYWILIAPFIASYNLIFYPYRYLQYLFGYNKLDKNPYLLDERLIYSIGENHFLKESIQNRKLGKEFSTFLFQNCPQELNLAYTISHKLLSLDISENPLNEEYFQLPNWSKEIDLSKNLRPNSSWVDQFELTRYSLMDAKKTNTQVSYKTFLAHLEELQKITHEIKEKWARDYHSAFQIWIDATNKKIKIEFI